MQALEHCHCCVLGNQPSASSLAVYPYAQVGQPVFSPNKKTEAVRYIEAYKKTHPVFTDVICSNLAGDLQSLDANIAVKVIDLMTQGGFPVLTVHDEFIVRRNDRKFLEVTVSLVVDLDKKMDTEFL